MALKPASSKTLLLFFLSFFLFLLVRFWNISGWLYFIYDQGRDAARLAELARGAIALVGPTTGIDGLFLGPLWYYVGLPGYFLSKGNPTWLASWFVGISALAFPGFWWLSNELFWKHGSESPAPSHGSQLLRLLLGWICLALFIGLPSSVISSTTIWNCLMAAPLMLGALYCFWHVRSTAHPERWVFGGFLCTALTLQSEFAYAVFFLPVLFLLIPWMTARKKLGDFVAGASAVLLTLLPQLAFEVRHRFIMVTSLLHTLSDHAQTVSWANQFAHRPMQLIDVTVDMFNNPDVNTWPARAVILMVLSLGVAFVVGTSNRRTVTHESTPTARSRTYLRQLIVLFAVLPYPFYLLWRGNGGNFFSYYFTSHFVFLVPLFVLGLQFVVVSLWKSLAGKILAGTALAMILIPILISSIDHWVNAIGAPVNQAGLHQMQSAVEEAYQLRNPDHSATLIITPNIHSIHYDYLFHHYADQHRIAPPKTIVSADDKQMLLVLEGTGGQWPDYVVAQRKALTELTDWRRKRVKFFGVITLEEWVR